MLPKRRLRLAWCPGCPFVILKTSKTNITGQSPARQTYVKKIPRLENMSSTAVSHCNIGSI
jgi:hypothetical protein